MRAGDCGGARRVEQFVEAGVVLGGGEGDDALMLTARAQPVHRGGVHAVDDDAGALRQV